MKKIVSVLLVLVLLVCNVNILTSCDGILQKVKGEQGLPGEKGDKGDQGEQGIQGETGNEGRGILKVEIIDGCLWITYTDDPENPVNVGTIKEDEPIVEHTFIEWITVKEATCTADGIEQRICTDCGYTESKLVKALGHKNVVTDKPVVPTCDQTGLSAGTRCSVCDEVTATQEVLPAKGYDWMLEDGEFKILLIGNSFSEDASNAGMPNSQMLDILQAMLGEEISVTVGLCYSGGKGLNWHATQSEQGKTSYSLRVISSEGRRWQSYGSYTSANALTWTDWDVVSLQHYEINTTTGKESNAYPDQVDPKFDTLKSATEFMLDYVDQYAPNAAVYFYMHWARAYKSNLNESRATYNKMAEFFPEVMDYAGTNSANRFDTIIPVGLAVQNARTTYLATLAYNTTAYADKNLNLQTDAQIGLQRDGGHLSYNIGRYIAALTFAETILPQSLRAEGYQLPDIRVTESIGILPKEYTNLSQKAVLAAVESWKQGSLDVTEIEGYTKDPTTVFAESLVDGLILDSNLELDDISNQVKKLIQDKAVEDLVVEKIEIPEQITAGETFIVTVTARFGYMSKTFSIDVIVSNVVQ